MRQVLDDIRAWGGPARVGLSMAIAPIASAENTPTPADAGDTTGKLELAMAEQDIPDRATGYETADGAGLTFLPSRFGAGNLLSTAEDIARWAIGLSSGSVLTNYERGDLGVLLDVLLADYLP